MSRQVLAPLPDEIRMDDEHIALAMYNERAHSDCQNGQAALYAKNPDARAMYFKGVQDMLIVLETWTELGAPPGQVANWIQLLRAQTKNAATAN